MWSMLLCLSGVALVYGQDSNQEGDLYKLTIILQSALEYNDTALHILNGIFSAGQIDEQNSVKVHYIIHIPMKEECNSDCNCWNDAYCNNNTENCPDGHCCIEKDFLWSRAPLIVQDEIYRAMTICPFILGSSSETSITIELKNQTILSQTPCTWCCTKGKIQNFVENPNFFDSFIELKQPHQLSLLDHALLEITERLQGISTKVSRLPWLSYPSKLADGYAVSYDAVRETRISIILLEYIGFLLSYITSNILLFILVYQRLLSFYIKIRTKALKNYPNTDKRIESAFLYSFVVTSIIVTVGIIVQTVLVGGLCLTILQLLLIATVLFFSLLHGVSVCYRFIKKRPKTDDTESNKEQGNYFNEFPITVCYRNHSSILCSNCVGIAIKVVILWFIYSFPHFIFYLLMVLLFNFFESPYSYFVLLTYLLVSVASLWIGNTIFFTLIFTTSFKNFFSKDMSCRKRIGKLFKICLAIFIAITVDIMYLVMWNFTAGYFYDERPQTSSFLTLVPGLITTLIGWYLSGDLLQLFENIMPEVPEEITTNVEEIETIEISKNIMLEVPREVTTRAEDIEMTETSENIMPEVPKKVTTHVKKIETSESIVPVVPKEVTTRAEEIEIIETSENIMSEVPEEVTTRAEEIEIIETSENIMSEVPEEVTTHVEIIETSENIMPEVPEEVTTHVEIIETSENIMPKVPEVITHVKKIETSESIVPVVPKEVTTRAEEIEIIETSENIMSEVPEEVTTRAEEIEIIETSENIMSEVPEEVTTHVEIIETSENIMPEVPEEVTTHVEIIETSENIMPEVPEEVTTHVEIIETSENIMPEVPEEVTTHVEIIENNENIMPEVPEEVTTQAEEISKFE